MMNKQRNLVIGLIIVLVLVIFACLNTEPVAINFGFFQPKMPLIIVLVIMLLLGALVSLLIGKGEKVSPDVKKALAKQKKELDNKAKENKDFFHHESPCSSIICTIARNIIISNKIFFPMQPNVSWKKSFNVSDASFFRRVL